MRGERQRPPSLSDLESVFAALAHQSRRHILLVLSHLGGELPSGYLAARFHHSWPTTTRHLNVLEQAGLVEVRREGRASRYRLNRERLEQVVGGWLRHLVPVDPTKTWVSSGRRSTEALATPPDAAAPPAAKTKAKPRRATRTKIVAPRKKGSPS